MPRARPLPFLVCCAAFAVPAAVQAQTLRFDLASQRLSDGVLAIGRQAGVSIGVRDPAACAGVGRAVRGRFGIEQALRRLLADSGCEARRIDAATYVVVPATGPSSPARDPAPAVAAAPSLLDSVVVSTTRRDALVGRTPYAISSISGASLAADGVSGSQGVAGQLAGLTATNLGAGRDKLLIRGMSDGAFTGRTQSTVGLYLDDVPITYSAPDPDLFLADVDRVEVLRGPQGSLYGVGSIGGVMRIVTRRPDPSGFHAAVGATVASTRGGGPGATVTGMANLPLVHDRIALRAVGYSEVSGGYLDNAALGLTDVNRTRRRGFRLAASARLDPDWRLSAGFTQQFIDAADGQSVPAGGGDERGRALTEPHDNDFRQASATLEGRGGWGALKVAAGYVRHDFNTRYDATPAAALYGLAPLPTAYDETNRVEFTVAEAVWSAPERRRLQGLVGAFVAHGEQNSQYEVGQGAPVYLEARQDALREAAIFGEASYALTDRLKLTLGARAFAASTRTVSTNRPGGADPGGRLRKADVAPKAVLAFQARPDLLVYVQAAEGYRLGGFNTSGLAGQILSGPGGPQPRSVFRPDELWSYELGVKTALLGGRMQLQAAAFYAMWKDVQSDQFLGSGLPYTANVGDADNRGLELEASLRIDPRLTVRTSLLLNSGELARPEASFRGGDDVRLPLAPGVAAVGVLEYRQPLAPGLTVAVHAQAEYVGRSRLGYRPVQGAPMGDYVTNQLSVQLAAERWRVRAFVENLADVRGDTFSFGNPFTGLQPYVTPLRPRTVGISVGADF